jgi:hypothetical protein
MDSMIQFVNQCFRLLQVLRIEPLGEPILEQIAKGFTKTDSGPCFAKLSTNGWILGVAVKTVHPEPVEG